MEDKKVPTRINAELIYYQLAEIKTQLQDFKVNYVTKEESAALKLEIQELRTDIAELKKSKTIMGWVYPTATAILTAVLTFIIIEFFRRKG
jgi:regulator of replication initiation timing